MPSKPHQPEPSPNPSARLGESGLGLSPEDAAPSLNRRNFLASAAALTASSLIPGLLTAQSEADLAADPQRPQFHLLPAHNWMNDPNGPIFFNGRYHMFFQFNPQAAVWGNMSWNHAVSPDMIHWTHLPLAMTPTPGSPDAYGCFSGTCIEQGKRVYAVYTGVIKSSTPTIKAEGIQESQCLAWSDDPNLARWTKDSTPILPAPPAGLDVTGFRDPSVWKQSEWFYMTVGSGIAKSGGCVLLYRSRDLKQWEYLHILTSGAWDGHLTPNPCDDGEMWECPDLFPLAGSSVASHVLIYSTLGKVFWQSGTLDSASMLFYPLKTGLLDLDAFYAPKTQLDARGRRILWGWIPERRPESAMRTAGWSGMMSLPRVLTLTADGTLSMAFLPELSIVRSSPISAALSDVPSVMIIRRACGEASYTGSRASGFTLHLSGWSTDRGQDLIVFYSPERHAFTIGGKEMSLQLTDEPSVHAYVDGSVIELLLGNRIAYTRRFYYSTPIAPDISISVTDGSGRLQAWTLNPISPNRLTTPV